MKPRKKGIGVISFSPIKLGCNIPKISVPIMTSPMKLIPGKTKRHVVDFAGKKVDVKTPHKVKRITDTINMAGGRSYIVGGFVRDKLLGHEPKDVDIEVHGMPIDHIKTTLEQARFKVDEVGKSFGVLKVKTPEGEVVDISIPRRDSTGRKPKVEFLHEPTPRDAASRRDFTINSIMYDTKDDKVVDPFGGVKDLERGVVRSVSPSAFHDDPLRAVRAAQFSSRFGFTIEPETTDMASRADVGAMSTERVRDEMLKALEKSKKPSIFFRELDKMGHLKTLFPEIYALKGTQQDPTHHHEGDAYVHTMMVLDKLAASGKRTTPMLLAAVLHDTGKPHTMTREGERIKFIGHEDKSLELTKKFVKRYRLPNDVSSEVEYLVKLHMDPHHKVVSKATALKHKNKLLVAVAGGWSSLMKDPRGAIRRYHDLIDFAMHDREKDDELYRELKQLPPVEHYIPKKTAREIMEEEGLEGEALGKRMVELYINQVNTR